MPLLLLSLTVMFLGGSKIPKNFVNIRKKKKKVPIYIKLRKWECVIETTTEEHVYFCCNDGLFVFVERDI